MLQKQLYEIGVDMEIEALPGRSWCKRLHGGRLRHHPASSARADVRSRWTYLTFHSTQSSSWATAAADTVLDRLRGTTTDATIRTAVSDLQQIFHDDPPAIFIAWPKVARVVSTKFVVPDEAGTRRR